MSFAALRDISSIFGGIVIERSPAHLFDKCSHALLGMHVSVAVLLRPLPVKSQYRHAPMVFDFWIQLAVAVVIGLHGSPSCQQYNGAVIASQMFLERRPVEPFFKRQIGRERRQ